MAKREYDNTGTGVVELEHPAVETDAVADIANKPRMIIAAGRGKVGKSVLLRWAIEKCIARGGVPIIADGDRMNPTLEAFFPNALRPPSAEDEDMRIWLNEQADTQIENRSTVFLDLGGGDQSLRTWAKELDLAPFLLKFGVVPVLLHVLGSDIDDLTYLRDLETIFAPTHTAIVLNEGMVPAGRSAGSAFEPFYERPEFTSAVNRGARVVRMPRLGCMQQIDSCRLSFTDAEQGKVKPGQKPIGPTTMQQIFMWQKEMATSFAPIAGWLT